MNETQKTRKFGWRWRLAAGVALGVVILLAAAATWPEKFLLVEQKPAKADAIVVLGGGITDRVPRAVELFQKGLAPIIVLSGEGDGGKMRRWLTESNVPADAVRSELKSLNTWQNAKFSVELLRGLGAKRVILVTSWFHSRRALACFRKAAPEIDFISLPTVKDRPDVHPLTKRERVRALYEYLKLSGYWVRYGVNPF